MQMSPKGHFEKFPDVARLPTAGAIPPNAVAGRGLSTLAVAVAVEKIKT
jgi:hypothetical protein